MSSGFVVDVWWIGGGCPVDWQWILNYGGLLVDYWWMSGGLVVDAGGCLVDCWWITGGCPVDWWWIDDGLVVDSQL